MKPRIRIDPKAPNRRVQNILGGLFILEAVVLFVLFLMGYV